MTADETDSGLLVIIAFGDSITKGTPYVEEKEGNGRRVGGYPPDLEDIILAEKGITSHVLNYGVGGENTLLGAQRMSTVLDKNPSAEYVLIMEGNNDTGLWSAETTRHNLRWMLDKARHRNVEPILATLTPDTSSASDESKIRDEINPVVWELGEEEGVRIADQYSATVDDWENLSVDGTHPNRQGYYAIARKYFNTLPLASSNLDGGGGGGGCFIATAAFGSALAPHVTVLKQFRDQVLSGNRWGQKLIAYYYRTSPPIADYIARHEPLRFGVRLLLYPVVAGAYMTLHHAGVVMLGFLMVIFSVIRLSARHRQRKFD